MSRYRFIVDINEEGKEPETGETLELEHKDLIHQLRKVLRLSRNSEIDILDGKGKLYACTIEKLDRESVTARIDKVEQEQRSDSPSVSIACAILRNDRFDLIVQKLTELGVERIIPIYTEHSVVKRRSDQEKEEKRLRRWMSIAKEASEQSERFRLPTIDHPSELEDFLKLSSEVKEGSAFFICAARDDAPPLVQQLLSLSGDKTSRTIPLTHIQIVIGPEGGFTRSEIDSAINSGFRPCNLAKTILRSETAAISSATIAVSLGDFL